MNQFWLFENINLFELLCPHKFKEFSKTHQFSVYDKGSYIYMEGDVAKNFFLVSKGKVKVGFWDESGDEIVMSYLKKGDIFGENIVLNQSVRKEFAQAIENNTELCPVNMREAEELMLGNKNFSISIYKFIGLKFRKIERKYQIMLFRNTKTRAIEFLKEMKEDDLNHRKMDNGDVEISNSYSQLEVAKLIGTSRPTFNLLLKELQEDGYIEWKKGKILLKNKFMLEF